MFGEDENPGDDNPQLALPNNDDRYSFSKVWIPVGIAVATVALWCMSISSAIGDVRCEFNRKLDVVSKLDDYSGYGDDRGNFFSNREMRDKFYGS